MIMAARQEVITKEVADNEIEMRKALGLEERMNERHALRMQWYRGRWLRQACNALAAAAAFAAVVYVISHYDWWTGVTAAVCAGAVIILMNIFNATAQPPEDRY
jgi:hypothetical protein